MEQQAVGSQRKDVSLRSGVLHKEGDIYVFFLCLPLSLCQPG